MPRTLLVLILLSLITAAPARAADEPAKKEKSGNKLERAVEKSGKTLGKTADRVEKSVKKGAQKTEKAINNTGEKTGQWIKKKVE